MTARVEKVLSELQSWWNKEDDSDTYNLILSFCDELDSYELEQVNLHTELYVNTATGQRLDDLGRLFKLARNPGELDDSYRSRIKSYWPGFSGGGTIPAIKSTINRITGVPEANVTVTDIEFMKFNVDTLLDSIEATMLVDTIREVVWDIKAAGTYPFFTWTLGGDLTSDFITVGDTVDIQYITTSPWFIWEASDIDGIKMVW